METSSPPRRLVRLALTLLVAVRIGTAAAAPPPVLVYTFPGCAPTLQDCVALAPEGSEIRVATNGPIDEVLTIERSLQLRAAPGFTPVLTPGSYILASARPGGDRHLVIQGLRWEPARSTAIRVTHTTDGSFQIELLDNAFVGITGGSSGDLVTVQTYSSPDTPPPGPIDLRIAGNVVDIPSNADASPFFLSFGRALDGVVRIEDNTIRTAGVRQNSAIGMYHSGGTLALDVARNVIASGAPGQVGGLFVWQTVDTTGRTIARVVNNVITGVDGGMLFGASFYASEGTIDLAVLHNTIAYAALRAVQVGGREDLGGAMSGIIANNVLVFSARSDVGIHEFGDAVIERRNLVTHIGGIDDAPSAPHPETIVVADPQFVGPDDHRLEATSLGVNTASLELLPDDLMHDLVRNPRVAGPAPDMGAYELPCAEDSTEPHCVRQPSCETTGCHSDDPCFPAQCVNDRCVVIEPVGFASAHCACDRAVPSSCPGTAVLATLVRRAERACALLERAVTLGSAGYYRLVTTARRRFDRAAWRTGRRAMTGQLPAACAADLIRDFTDAEARVNRLLK